MIKFLLLSFMILLVSCGGKESSNSAETLNSAIYGGTWRYDNGNTSTFMVFTGNQVNVIEEASGVQVSDNTYTITPSGSAKATVNVNGTPETWNYSVSGNNLNLCINSCVTFTR